MCRSARSPKDHQDPAPLTCCSRRLGVPFLRLLHTVGELFLISQACVSTTTDFMQYHFGTEIVVSHLVEVDEGEVGGTTRKSRILSAKVKTTHSNPSVAHHVRTARSHS